MKKLVREVERVVKDKVYKTLCDICNGSIPKTKYHTSYYVCYVCKRDVCNKCNKEFRGMDDDYPDILCLKCHEIREKYNLKIEKLEDQVCDLEEQFEKECKEARDVHDKRSA
jgi:hypothetical protein